MLSNVSSRVNVVLSCGLGFRHDIPKLFKHVTLNSRFNIFELGYLPASFRDCNRLLKGIGKCCLKLSWNGKCSILIELYISALFRLT